MAVLNILMFYAAFELLLISVTLRSLHFCFYTESKHQVFSSNSHFSLLQELSVLGMPGLLLHLQNWSGACLVLSLSCTTLHVCSMCYLDHRFQTTFCSSFYIVPSDSLRRYWSFMFSRGISDPMKFSTWLPVSSPGDSEGGSVTLLSLTRNSEDKYH